MALHTKKEFADLCGIQTKDLSNYIRRGKVILSGDLIDMSITENSAFYEKRKTNAAPVSEIKLPQYPPGLDAPDYSKKKKVKYSEPTSDLSERSLFELTKLKLEKEIEEKDQKIELLKKRNEKMDGESIPTDLVKVLVAQLSKSMTASFQIGADNFLIEISTLLGITPTQMAELRGKLVVIINKGIEKSVAEARQNIKNIAEEYATKKEVGEKAS